MNKLFLPVFLLGVFSVTFGQTTSPPQTTSIPNPTANASASQAGNNNRAISQNDIKILGKSSINELSRQQILQYQTEQLYRKPTKKELTEIAVEKNILEENKLFLNQKDTGIFRLINDKGCAEDTRLLKANEDCLKFKFPGNGSGFSFRVKNYRILRLADLILKDGKLLALGTFRQGIMVNLGDVVPEKVSINQKEAEFLQNYQPALFPEDLQKEMIKFKSGISIEKIKYASVLTPEINTTYLLRSIAYRGKYFQSAAGITYNEFEFDKRKDILVVFRVVDKDGDGNLTIMWKELKIKDSPKLIIEKDTDAKDVRNEFYAVSKK
jgi:hypothetical protein